MPVGTQLTIARQVRRAMIHLGADCDQLVPISWHGDRLYPLFEQLGATSDLLGVIRAYGETLDDKEVLGALKRWNAQRRRKHDPAREVERCVRPNR
jgi:hypothetical protein